VRVEFEKQFRLIQNEGFGKRFYRYLLNRGFSRSGLDDLIAIHGLRYSLTGAFAHRVIIPVFEAGELVGWTARAIVKAEIRYLAFPAGPVVKEHLLGVDQVSERSRLLLVVEGPFDLLKARDLLRGEERISSVALMGVAPTASQVGKIADLAARFSLRPLIAFDPDAQAPARRLARKLAIFRAAAVDLRALCGGGDLGDLSGAEDRRRLMRFFLRFF